MKGKTTNHREHRGIEVVGIAGIGKREKEEIYRLVAKRLKRVQTKGIDWLKVSAIVLYNIYITTRLEVMMI